MLKKELSIEEQKELEMMDDMVFVVPKDVDSDEGKTEKEK